MVAVSVSFAIKSKGLEWFLKIIEKQQFSVTSKFLVLKRFFLDANFSPDFKSIKSSVCCPPSTSLICEIKILLEGSAEWKKNLGT